MSGLSPSVLLRFLYSQFFIKPPYPTTSWAGKTVVVTGSNVGLGLEAARHFARLGAQKVILGVRNVEKGSTARKSIIESTGCGEEVVEVWQLDLSAYDSVKSFAKRVEGLQRLDAIVENAGIATDRFVAAESGEEMTIATNVVATFLLALLVLPKLKETAQRFNTRPHLVIVSSEVHFFTNLPERKTVGPNENLLASLSDKSKARMGDRYNVSKLLEVLACRQIVEELMRPGYPVILNFVNPGLCHSELGREMGLGFYLFKLAVARTTEVGSRTLVHAASAGEESHGQYLSDARVSEPAKFVKSEEGKEVQKRVWRELSERLEQIQPGIMRNF